MPKQPRPTPPPPSQTPTAAASYTDQMKALNALKRTLVPLKVKLMPESERQRQVEREHIRLHNAIAEAEQNLHDLLEATNDMDTIQALWDLIDKIRETTPDFSTKRPRQVIHQFSASEFFDLEGEEEDIAYEDTSGIEFDEEDE